MEKVKDLRLEYEIKLKKAEDSFNLKQAQLDSSNLDLIDLKAKFYKANMNFLNYKSNVDVQKYGVLLYKRY